MTPAVVITTYNQPEWLEKVLWGYACQTTNSFEVVVADDGSGEATRRVIERARNDFRNRLRHVWHEDKGFRKCEILNRAILVAESEYLIFTDGDCIPRDDFVQAHIELAEPGRFLSGGVVWLPRELSHQVTRADIEANHIGDRRWMRKQGWRGGRRRLRLVRNSTIASALDWLTPTGASFNGHNASVWRESLIEANGFDAEMGYGGLDRALGERLQNLGLQGKQVRHRAVCFHLDHDRPYRKPEVVQRNREIRARIRASGEVRARAGIRQLSAGGRTIDE
jgi:glycosyltransferase involved in cell wall biosynthesis